MVFKIATKKKKDITIEVVGGNAESVTGSCTKIEFNKRTILFELGMIQDYHTVLENYKVNCAMFNNIKCKDVEMVIVGHNHSDHICNIPMLYARGSNAKIIAPKNSTSIMREMWMDCAYINGRDVESLNVKGDKRYTPLYTEHEVEIALQHVQEINIGEIVKLDEELSIRYTPAGHILCSCQTELFFNINSHTKKILFTSDLGNPLIENRKVFVEHFQKVNSANIVFGECTYGLRGKSMSKKDIDLDREKMKTVIEQFCVDNKHRVLIPCFSLDRTPFILWEIYQLFGNDKTFNIPIVIDSPLSNRLLDCYSSILEGDAKVKFDEMMSWKNIKRVITPEDSKACVSEKAPKVILSSSGMLCAGRAVKYVQNMLPNENDCILFVGFSTIGTLSWKIKNLSDQKTININGKPYKNKCQICDLHSYSSHMQRSDLLNYYKQIQTEKIYLVHGDKQARIDFKEDLENELEKSLKSTRVVIVNKGMKIKL